mmetsp:Transcript_27516/g.69108  ORF Transcript_27516/g.69108 Transcript_27516/m.69108 type:complete len:90 (-) Transcript_27516:103-372(-)
MADGAPPPGRPRRWPDAGVSDLLVQAACCPLDVSLEPALEVEQASSSESEEESEAEVAEEEEEAASVGFRVWGLGSVAGGRRQIGSSSA